MSSDKTNPINETKMEEQCVIPARKMYFSVWLLASRTTIIAKINGLISVSKLGDQN